MKPLLPTLSNFFFRHALERDFFALLQAKTRACRGERVLQSLSEPEREVLARGVSAGIPSTLKPGLVDNLLMVPELACALVQHGARPTGKFLDALGRWDRNHWIWRCVSRDEEARIDPPVKVEGWLNKLVGVVATRHPELDWFRPTPRISEKNPDQLFVFTLDTHFEGLTKTVIAARKARNLPLGPYAANPQVYDWLLEDLTYPYSKTRSFVKTERHAWLEGLLSNGANPNAIIPGLAERPLPILARAMRTDETLIPALLDGGATVSPQVLGDVVYVMHDSQNTLRRSRSETQVAFMMMWDRCMSTVDLDAIVPSCDYGSPTMSFVLQKHYPELFQDLCWRRDAVRLEESTPEACSVGPSRRL